MNEKLKGKTTIFCKVMNVLGILAGAVTIIFLLLYWKQIPSQIPVHYDGSGIVNGWSHKSSIWTTPVISWILFLVLSVAGHDPSAVHIGVRITPENKENVYTEFKNMMAAIKFVLMILLNGLTILSARGIAILPKWLLPLDLLVTVGVIAIFCLRIHQKNKVR